MYQVVTIDAKREQFCYQTVEKLINSFKTAFNDVRLPDGMTVMLPKNMKDTSLQYQMMYVQCYKMFQSDLMSVTQPTIEIIDLVKRNLENILQGSALTVRGLKRFVKEHKST